MELARVMHRSRMSKQLAALRDGVTHLQPADAGVGRAWTLGLLSHYILDRNAHPFVYAQHGTFKRRTMTLRAREAKFMQ